MVVVHDCYLHCGIVLMVIVTGDDVAQKYEQCLGTRCPIFGQWLPVAWGVRERLELVYYYNAEKRILLYEILNSATL